MSFLAQADLAEDPHLLRRAAACAITEGITEYPTTWVARHLWTLAATPGWAALYETARAREGEYPPAAADGDIITDAMIADAVRALIVSHTPPPEPEPDPESPAE